MIDVRLSEFMHSWLVWSAQPVVFVMEMMGLRVEEGVVWRRTTLVGGSRAIIEPLEGKTGWLCDSSGKNRACAWKVKRCKMKRIEVETTGVRMARRVELLIFLKPRLAPHTVNGVRMLISRLTPQ